MTDNNVNKDSYLFYKHLFVSVRDNKVFYLGYKLPLTKTEYYVLKILINSQNTPISADEIASIISQNMKKENAIYHISRINCKAKNISERILIKNFAKNGYFLNEEM